MIPRVLYLLFTTIEGYDRDATHRQTSPRPRGSVSQTYSTTPDEYVSYFAARALYPFLSRFFYFLFFIFLLFFFSSSQFADDSFVLPPRDNEKIFNNSISWGFLFALLVYWRAIAKRDVERRSFLNE